MREIASVAALHRNDSECLPGVRMIKLLLLAAGDRKIPFYGVHFAARSVVIAAVDIRPEHAEKAAEPTEAGVHLLDDLLTHEKPDVIDICTLTCIPRWLARLAGRRMCCAKTAGA
jgi:hypothetical protein